jgi:RHS repeat-associated protein
VEYGNAASVPPGKKFGQTKFGGGEIGPLYGQPKLGAPGEIPPGQGGNIAGRLKYAQGTKNSVINYDKLSRIKEYTDFFGNSYNYNYDAYGRMETIKYPNGLLTVYGYDESGRLGGITHKRESGETLRSFTYQYDLNRNITKITNEDGSLTDYVYDDWNRLTRETWKNALGMTTLDIQYTFDNAAGDTGNIHQKILTRNGGTPETTIFAYDEYNKLTTVQHPGSVVETLTYSANGQLTRSSKSNGEITSYYWNDQGFLTKVLLPSGEPVEYKYDGVGRLVGRKDADGEQVFVQAGWSIMTEQDTEGRRTYYTGSSAVKDNSSDRTYFHFNHRGDTVLVSDGNGIINNALSYEAYGTPTNSIGIPLNKTELQSNLQTTPNLFVGAYGIRYDVKTELSYMRFRWYDNSKMRFVNSDLLIAQNRYAYSLNEPMRHIDPLGLNPFSSFDKFILNNFSAIFYTPRQNSQLSSGISIMHSGTQITARPEANVIPPNDILFYNPPQSWMIWAGTHATGLDFSATATTGVGYAVGGGIQVVANQRGEADIFYYVQHGVAIYGKPGVSGSFGGFVIKDYNKNNYLGRAQALNIQASYFGLDLFKGNGKDAPCGGGPTVNYPPGFSANTVHQTFYNSPQELIQDIVNSAIVFFNSKINQVRNF